MKPTDRPTKQPIVDSQPDLAENVKLFCRDLTASVAEILMLEQSTSQQATVSLDGLESGGVAFDRLG